ncbi:MAG: cell envelope integrity protein CreD [Rhodoferax sp.]|jgi:inner membrane protein|nr:cell envelope integrity protein CreD [Rhodoferax sp.]MBP9685794.1 cell envelope integrity protein CreD [Rhodoferax sp.]
MKNLLLQKCALVAFIGALLMIPLAMIERTIDERTMHRAQAIEAIAASTAGEQSIVGPVMTVPVEEEYDDELVEVINGESKKKLTRRKRLHTLTVMPRQVHIDGGLNVEKRAYGLHETAVFELQGKISGSFETPGLAALPALGPNAHLTWGTPTVSVGIADPRGITGEPKITLGGQALSLRPGAHVKGMKTGFHATAPSALSEKAETMAFRIDLSLAGTGTLGLVPLGEVSTAELRGNWPHPSFSGDFLPRSRDVGAAGFTARWSTTALASNAQTSTPESRAKGFQVRLIDPVDVYRQALRAVKYGILFIVLTFSAFFMFEQLRNLPIHPIQYLLVGLAQAVFFLLLTSLSEHISFSLAYLVAASGSIGLIGIYLAAILRGWRRGLGFTAALSLLYGALFGILRSEQNALLLGSLLLFVALAALMLGTRRIDWYRMGSLPGSASTVSAG